MKNKIGMFFGITILLTFIFTFSACSTDNDDPKIPGLVTVINLPDEYSIEHCSVNENPNYTDWLPNGSGVRPNTTWDETVIGIGAMNGVKTRTTIEISSPSWNFTNTGSYTLFIAFYKEGDIYGYGINQVWFSSGKATVNFATFSFTLPDTNGKLTFTNASEFNNKYAIVFGSYGSTPTQSNAIYGFNNATSISDFKGFKIENGDVTIPLYQITYGDNKFTAFDYSGEASQLVIIILETEDFDYIDFADVFPNPSQTKYKCLLYMSLVYGNAIMFSNGAGNANASQGTRVGF